MLEAEEAFVDSIDVLTNRVEAMIKTVTREILNGCDQDIRSGTPKDAQESLDFGWLEKPFPVLSYKEAHEILTQNSDALSIPVRDEGFSKDHELFLVKHVGAPLFVVDWPAALKPFYMRSYQNNTGVVGAFDFLMPGTGELVGGGLREDKLEELRQNVPEDLDWYLDLRRYGNCRSGGFGLGFERYLQILMNVPNIREVTPFPRSPNNCKL